MKAHHDQHFLIDKNAVNRICRSCRCKGKEEYLEIGPGNGALTRALLPGVPLSMR